MLTLESSLLHRSTIRILQRQRGLLSLIATDQTDTFSNRDRTFKIIHVSLDQLGGLISPLWFFSKSQKESCDVTYLVVVFFRQ